MEVAGLDRISSLAKAIALFVLVHLALVGFGVEEEGLIGIWEKLIWSMHTGINHVADAGPRLFVYSAEAYAGIVFICLGIIVIPLVGDKLLKRYTSNLSRRGAFILAVAICGYFRVF